MARAYTGAEAALLAATARETHLRVSVADADLTFQDLRAVGGIDWHVAVELQWDIDQPVSSATISLLRDAGSTKSLAPLRTDSTINRKADLTFGALIDAGRQLTVETAVVALGGTPAAGDWKNVWAGYIDTVEWGKNPLVLTARDDGSRFQDIFYTTERPGDYSAAPLALESVMGELVTEAREAAGWPDTITLRVPVSPSYVLTRFPRGREAAMDALLRCAQVIGWDVRSRWSESDGAWRLTLQDPNRTKTVPDFTLVPSQYLDVAKVAIDRTAVRNKITVVYPQTNPATASSKQETVTATDADSVSRYGARSLVIEEPSDSPIDTDEEATRLRDLVLSDLKDPKAEQEITALYDWRVELHDLVRCQANGVHYNTDQDLAVVGIKHRLDETTARTTLTVRGSPAGAYLNWMGRGRYGGTSNPELDRSLNNVRVTADDNAGIETVSWDRGAQVAFVFVYDRMRTLPLTADPWPVSGDAPDAILAVSEDSYTVAVPPTGTLRFLQFEPRRGSDFAPIGPVRRRVVASDLDTLFAECRARITAADDTTITVTVDGVSPSGTPTVQLVAVTGSATLASGPAIGVASPSGTVWVFDRGAFQAGAGQAQFRAVLDGVQSDDDLVVLPEQGRDTIALTCQASVIATNATQLTVRVVVTDPIPQGTGEITLTATAAGCTISPTTPQTLDSGGHVDFTIDRPSFQAGTGRVVFLGTAANRVEDLDAVDVPAQERDTASLRCEAHITASDDTTITVDVTVTDPVDQGGSYLVITPTPVGCTVTPNTASADQASGATLSYVIDRPAAGSGPGRVVFTATDTNGKRVQAIDAVDVSPQDVIVPVIDVAVTPGATDYSIDWSATGTVSYKIDGGSWTTPGVGVPPLVVSRNAIGGADQVVTLRAVLNGQTETNSITVPAQVLGSVTLSGVVGTRDDATHLGVDCTRSGFPSGVTFNVAFTIDGLGGGNSDGHADGDFPLSINIASLGSMGASPSGSVRVDAILNGAVIATKTKNGPFAT